MCVLGSEPLAHPNPSLSHKGFKAFPSSTFIPTHSHPNTQRGVIYYFKTLKMLSYLNLINMYDLLTPPVEAPCPISSLSLFFSWAFLISLLPSICYPAPSYLPLLHLYSLSSSSLPSAGEGEWHTAAVSDFLYSQ